jgi:hypothetical protein
MEFSEIGNSSLIIFLLLIATFTGVASVDWPENSQKNGKHGLTCECNVASQRWKRWALLHAGPAPPSKCNAVGLCHVQEDTALLQMGFLPVCILIINRNDRTIFRNCGYSHKLGCHSLSDSATACYCAGKDLCNGAPPVGLRANSSILSGCLLHYIPLITGLLLNWTFFIRMV